MPEFKPIIKKSLIKKLSVNIQSNRNSSILINASCKAKIRQPLETNNTVLLSFEEEISSTDDDSLKISLEGDIIFSFDYQPLEDEPGLDEKLMPIAMGVFFEKTDNILVEMGYKPIGLKANMATK